jgi:hypothetical protein
MSKKNDSKRQEFSATAIRNISMGQENICAMHYGDDIKCKSILYNPKKNAYIGRAAHIIDAAVGAKKRSANQENITLLKKFIKKNNPNWEKLDDNDLIRSEYNCLVVCANCHAIIDVPNFNVEDLLNIKQKTMDYANNSDNNIINDIALIGNDFMKSILNKIDLSDINIDPNNKFKKIGKNNSYTIYEKIDHNKLYRYKSMVETVFEINDQIKELIENYGDKIILFYNFFHGCYNKAKIDMVKKGYDIIDMVEKGDDIIDFVIEEVENNIKSDLLVSNQVYNVASYFVLHSFIECKILEKPKKNGDI